MLRSTTDCLITMIEVTVDYFVPVSICRDNVLTNEITELICQTLSKNILTQCAAQSRSQVLGNEAICGRVLLRVPIPTKLTKLVSSQTH